MPSIELIRKIDLLDPDFRDVLYTFIGEIERNREESVSKVEFNELKDIVKSLAIKIGELTEAQKRADGRFEELTKVQTELAEAQKKTEGKIWELTKAQTELVEAQKRTESRLEELAEAQKRTESRLEELAEAQKRTESRLEELAEAQKKTESKIGELTKAQKELAEAQKKTEAELQKLVKEHGKTRKQLGGLEKNVAFRLEDMSYKALPELLKRDYGLIVKEELKRDFLKNKKGEDVEVNIVGKASKDGKDYLLIGESKCHLSINDINHFIKSRLKLFEGVYKEELFPVLVTYMVTGPSVRDYAKVNGMALYYSYQF